MSKYSFKFKLKVVTAYLNGEGGGRTLAKKYGVKSYSQVKRWIKNYQAFGVEGLKERKSKTKYTSEFKQSVVELYLTSILSYQQIALQYGINNPTLIARWKSEYIKDGVNAFVERPKGRPPTMKKSETKQSKPKKPIRISQKELSKLTPEQQRILELEKQLRYAQIENAYLKELRRLRLEEAREMKKSQESSTASEESSH